MKNRELRAVHRARQKGKEEKPRTKSRLYSCVDILDNFLTPCKFKAVIPLKWCFSLVPPYAKDVYMVRENVNMYG
ncbi:hypothetical protein [Neobacillus mesonae]|uniref:hypothetical protein n=1 Tax=Neobacillus mesonae TaxID=1193713 RepID=UPI002040AEB2|nr:hypothetical protein [Neobacillus mesonae]MCM3569728.1 hypothetical protein [Neobacillus mesonae]